MIRRTFFIILSYNTLWSMLTKKSVSFCETPRVRYLISEKELAACHAQIKKNADDLKLVNACITIVRKAMIGASGHRFDEYQKTFERLCKEKMDHQRAINRLRGYITKVMC